MKSKLLALMGCSLEQVETMWHHGTVPEKVYRAFYAVWAWSAPRFGGAAGDRQDSFYWRYGMRAYRDRINKTRAAFGFPPY